jgi:hypothetical protein
VETETETGENDESESESDDEEYELEEVEIDGVTYCTCNENGKIYELIDGGDVGKRVGRFKDGVAVFKKH